MDGKAAPAAPAEEPPRIEHITQNFVPLRAILLNATARCGKELANVLRTTESLPNDAARKRQFLDFVVACRQEYVKLYVLCKWAVVSPDISRAIDVANWLFGQISCFNNVIGVLFRLQADLGAAKAPWADLDTGLHVYKYGKPQPTPEAKIFMSAKKLDDSEVLRILRRLDVLIAVRLALHEHLPPLYQNYVVKNGRARFIVGEGVFWIEIGVAEEEVAAQSRFFFVDCGLGHATEPTATTASTTASTTTITTTAANTAVTSSPSARSSRSDAEESPADALSPSFKQRIEAAVNEQLTTLPLVRVLDWISLFCSVHRLQLIDRQLAAAEREAGLWAGIINHRYNPAKSEIVINYCLGSREPSELTLFMHEKAPHELVVTPPIDGVTTNGPIVGFATRLLSEATKQHAAKIISLIEASWIGHISEFTLAVELTASRRLELSVDPTSAQFALSGGGKLISEAQNRLNSANQSPLQVLSELRVQVNQELIASRAEAVGWRAQPNIRLAPGELDKIAPATTLLALRLPRSQGWCLTIALGGPKPRWFATRLRCSQRRWSLGPIHDVHTTLNLDDPDYSTFVELADLYTRQFVLYELGRELTAAHITHSITTEATQSLKVVANLSTIIPESSLWAHSGLVCTVDDNGIRAEGQAFPGQLTPLGDITDTVGQAEIVIHGQVGSFAVTTKQHAEQLAHLIDALKALHHAAQSLSSATSLGLEVRSATLSSLEIRYANQNGVLSVHNGSKIAFADTNPQKLMTPFLPAVQNHCNSSLDRVVSFLKQSYPVWEILAQLDKQHPGLQLAVLPQMASQVRIQLGFDPDAPCLELSYRNYRNQRSVHFLTAHNGAENSPTIMRVFKERTRAGIVPLVTGCAIELGHEDVLRTMVQEGLVEAQAAAGIQQG